MIQRKKGQGLVEFAIVLPFFLLFLIGGYLTFMLCYDYMTLATLARDSARELSVSSDLSTTRDAIIERKETADNNALLGAYYSWNPTKGDVNDTAFSCPIPSSSNTELTVTMRASRKQGGLNDVFSILPDTITAQSVMYWEYAKSGT